MNPVTALLSNIELNPAWISAALTATGLVANALWSVLNWRIEGRLKHLEGRIELRILELKEWTRKEFVAREQCRNCPVLVLEP